MTSYHDTEGELSLSQLKKLMKGEQGIQGWEGRTPTHVQESKPTGKKVKMGDLWFQPSTEKLYLYSGEWEEIAKRGIEGLEGKKGKDGKTPVAGVDFKIPKDGKDGKDGKDADIVEVISLIETEVGEHDKKFDHTLLHESYLLGTMTVDESQLSDGKTLVTRGKKLVYEKLRVQQAVITQGGGGTPLPSQLTHSGKFLKTNGADLSWGAVTEPVWGAITGTLSSQTDLQTALDLKANLTTPTFVTNITTPLVIGGTAVGSQITYKSTTGAGTATGIAHQFIGGTDGATTSLTILNNANMTFAGLASLPNGALSAAGLALYFTADTDTGFYRAGVNELQLVVGGFEKIGATSQGIKIGGGGSVTAPAIFINGDTNTGMYWDGADNLALTTGGVARIYAKSDGNVGIGETSPSAQLHVKAALSTTIGLITQAAVSQTANLHEWQNSAGTVLSSVSPSGKIGVGGTATFGGVEIIGHNGGDPYYANFVIRPAAGATGNDRASSIALESTFASTTQRWYYGSGSGNNNNFFRINNLTAATEVLAIEPTNSRIGIGAYFGTNTPVGQIHISSNSATTITQILQAAAGQSANISEWRNSALTVLSSINFAGGLRLVAGTATANTAPLKLTTGTLNTTAEVGAVEYNNTFHVTNSDAVRRHIATAPNTTKVTAGAPYTNDGYVVINIGGTDFKMMTTA